MSQGRAIFEAERRSKICIVGFADSKKYAPFADESWWLWGVNDAYHHLPRIDVTFELHHLENMGPRRNPDHPAVLMGGGRRGSQTAIGNPATPIVVQAEKPEWPTSMTYPKDEVFEAFGESPGGTYFTNSIGWMIALAILELTEVREINGRPLRVAKPGAELGCVGVSMAADSEYIGQRPNVEYWLGRAIGYGIKVIVPDDAHILKSAAMYGYSSSEPLRIRLQADRQHYREQTIQINGQVAQLQQQLQMLNSQLDQIRGMKGYIDMLERNLTLGTDAAPGSTNMGPHVGRDVILTLQDGQVVENLVVSPSDGQPTAEPTGAAIPLPEAGANHG